MRTGRPKKHNIKLTKEEEKELEGLVKRGKHSARVITRARILLLLNEGKKQKEIISLLKISAPTIWRIAKRYCEEGLSSALEEKPRPGAKPKLDAKGEAHLIALACSEVPGDRESWTMQLLAEQIVELGIVDEISDETVRRIEETNKLQKLFGLLEFLMQGLSLLVSILLMNLFPKSSLWCCSIK